MIEAWFIWEGLALLFCIRLSYAVAVAVFETNGRDKALVDIYFLMIAITCCFIGVALTSPNGGS